MSAVIEKQVLAFGKSEKSEFINIRIFAASSGGHKGRRHIGRVTPDRERSHVCRADKDSYRHDRRADSHSRIN